MYIRFVLLWDLESDFLPFEDRLVLVLEKKVQTLLSWSELPDEGF